MPPLNSFTSSAPLEGLSDKISLIRRYSEESLTHPVVRRMAEESAMNEHNLIDLKKLFSSLRASIRYVKDPVGAEYIKAPWVMADEIRERGYATGDCDDLSCLAYSLLRSIGVPARLVVGWYDGHPNPSHIWVRVPLSSIPRHVWEFDLVAPVLGMTKANPDRVAEYP